MDITRPFSRNRISSGRFFHHLRTERGGAVGLLYRARTVGAETLAGDDDFAGRFTTKGIRDPRVGRDILYGAAMGGLFAILKLVQIRLHGAAAPPSLPDLVGLGGLRPLASFGLQTIDGAMFDPMIVLFVLFLMRVLLRKQWIAATLQ